MSWVATAVVGGAVLGVGGSIAAADSQRSAANKASDASNYATDQASDVQREMFYRGLQENQPYKEKGLSALAQYSSAILGGPQQYADPTYMQLSGDDLTNLNAQGGATQYDPNKTWYRGPNGEITERPPTLTANYDYKSSPSLIPQTRAYNRALASRGLSGSGQAATGIADLANTDYSTQISRLAGLAGVGQSASNANASAGNALGGSLASLYASNGTNQANSALAAGEAKAGLYSGIGGAAMGGANTFMLGKGLKLF